MKVMVIGGGNSALVEATLLAEICKKVTIVQNLDVLSTFCPPFYLINY